MGNWSEKQEEKKETKEKDKTRKGNIAKYFLDLSKLTFVALVLGGITPFYTNNDTSVNWYVLIAGTVLTIVLAKIGNRILKQEVTMTMLGAIFTVGSIISAIFLAWTYTKPGKKWLKNL